MADFWDTERRLGRRKCTPEEYLKRAYLTQTDAEIAEYLNQRIEGADLTPNAVSKKRQRLGLRKTRYGIPLVFTQDRRRYDKPPVLETDSVMVLADVHIPNHDAGWCSELVDLARTLGITTCLLAGDLLDFSALSSFTPEMLGDEAETTLVSDEIIAAAEFVDVLLSVFDEVHMILGNHEKRITRRMAVKMRVAFLRQLLGYRLEPHFHLYPYYMAIIRASAGDWRVAHPKNTSVIPVRVAARLADKYGQFYVAAHGHDWGETTSVAGYYAAATGICADPRLFEYTQLRDNLRPFMQQGAWMLYEGQPWLMHPQYRRAVMVKELLK